MQIDDDERVSIWLAGNTGLRNPARIHEGFAAFAKSSFVGRLHGRDNELGFMNLLNEEHVIKNQDGKDASGSHARKWRLMFERYGLIYGQAKKENGFSQDELGPMDEITPFGRVFLEADTVPAVQECFLRALGVEQYWLPDKSGHYSRFRWILAIMLELERQTGSSEFSRIEFALWGQTTNPSYDIEDVVRRILDLRQRRAEASAKRAFDRKEVEERARHYKKKKDNFLDYCDMNMRYLRISGVLQRKGTGLVIAQSKHVIAEAMARDAASMSPMLAEFKSLTTGAPLPTDDLATAKAVLEDLMKQMRARNIVFVPPSLPLDTPAEVNVARKELEDILAKTDEIRYASVQHDEWREISDYMSLLINRGGKKDYGDDYAIEVPKDEAPAYLEWTMWRAMLAIDHLVNAPYEVRGFRLDSDFLPVATAKGGRGDLYCEFEDFVILIEVTMSASSRQEAMEGEPVRRHVSDAALKYHKPVFGLFVAPSVDTNTAETFRHGMWYVQGDIEQRLDIVPLTLKQFKGFFDQLFESDCATTDELLEVLRRCVAVRDECNAPAWKERIEYEVMRQGGGAGALGYTVPRP